MKPGEIEMAKLYFEEFKYRHENYWKAFFKFAAYIGVVLAIPYLHPEEIRSISKYVILFPILGIILSIVASWILAAEYDRIRVTYEKFTDIKSDKYKPIPLKQEGIRKLLKPKIGHIVTLTFLVGFLLLSIFDLIILLTLN